MKDPIIKELQHLKELIDENSISELELFLINTNLSQQKVNQMINILHNPISPIVTENQLLKDESKLNEK